METEVTLLTNSLHCLTLTHHNIGSTMDFSKRTWKYFHQKQIIHRLQTWELVAQGEEFRQPSNWSMVEDNLIVSLPSLPVGFLPISAINTLDLGLFSKIRIIIALTEALAKLHKHQFYMGFLVPKMIFFHPKSHKVILDIQPYTSSYPFVNKLLGDYPYIILSSYSRKHEFSRICDFYSIGLMIHWIVLGHFPKEPRSVEASLPPLLHSLCSSLMLTPERFIFVEEITNELRQMLGEDIVPITHYTSSPVWLHPMAPPINCKNQATLRSFLRTQGMQMIGILCEDEVTRINALRHHVIEVLEDHFFFNIRCKTLPFAALREAIDRTLLMAYENIPESSSKLRGLSRKFERLISRHSEGNDLDLALADWLFSFYTEMLPLFQLQSLYYIYENCEHIDTDSQRVFLLFWQKYNEKISGLHVIFSGASAPSLFPDTGFYKIALGQKEAGLYRDLLESLFGRADASLLEILTTWFVDKQIEFHQCPSLITELIRRNCVQLTRQGWVATSNCLVELDKVDPDLVISLQITSLPESDMELLRIFACMPVPINARSIFISNGLDDNQLTYFLKRMVKASLLLVFTDESVFMPFDVAKRVLHDLPTSEQVVYYKKALPLTQKSRYITYPVLIEIAGLADEPKIEYYYSIKYYRQIRNLLTLDRRKALLENIRQLQHRLHRTKILCWDRLLCLLYMRLNSYDQAEKLADSLYKKTNKAFDRFILMRIKLFTNQLDAVSVKHELLSYLGAEENIVDKVHAAHLFIYLDFILPLHRDVAEILHQIYLNEIHPNRHQISTRSFAEISIMYTIMLFQYFPELEEWASSLLDKVESVLEGTPHQDLMIELTNSYIFHSNVRLGRRNLYRCLDISRRYGFTGKEQISHLNGMEITLFQGDLTSYRYHLYQASRVGKLQRRDLNEQYHTHQLFYACEWEQWDVFDEIFNKLTSEQMTSSGKFVSEVFRRYAAFRRGEELPLAFEWEQDNEFTLFIDGLYAARLGDVDKACDLFRKSIAKNGYRLQAGWSYREMIELLLTHNSNETGYWLERFEEYLKKYSYDVFWPDLHRAYANWIMRQGDLQKGMLYLRRSVNGYKLIEKNQWYEELSTKLRNVVQPQYIHQTSSLTNEPIVLRLMEEREQLLHQSLDLQIIIQLSEQVTESLELANTFQQLSNSLFRYFPVTHTSISCNLFYSKETFFYSASGLIDKNDKMLFQRSRQSKTKLDYLLYQQGDEFIKLTVYANDLAETNRQHMENFLSFIKPHISNGLHYMEMMIDNLTGFYQRRYFLGQLQTELDISLRHGLDMSLIMIDIDNFRKVNEFGHQEGDKVLREISDMIRSILRKKDIPGRFGGEELLLILPKTDGLIAQRIAEDLRQQIEEEFSNGRPYQVTISAGVASLELCQTTTIDQLIRKADDAEILAKTTGKNKVVVAWE